MKKSGRKATAMLLAAALTVSGLPGLLAAEAEAAPLETVGKNLVLGKDVIASSTANNAGPELAVDGVKDQAQQWNSDDMKSWTASDTSRDEEEQTPQWIQIDRGADAEPASITSIKLWYNMKVWPMEYQILTAETSDLTADPEDTSVDLAEWTEVVSVKRQSSNGFVVNGTGQDIADTEANTDTITEDTTPALAKDVQLQRYVLVYITKVNAQAPGNNVNLREIEIFDDTVNVDVDAVLDSISAQDLVITDGKVTVSKEAEGAKIYVRGSDLENVVDNDGNLNGYNIGDKEVTLIVRVENEKDPSQYAEKNLTVIVPDQSAAYPQEYFPQTAEPNAKPEVIPSLQEWYGYSGEFELSEATRIIYNDAAGAGIEAAAANMKTDLLDITGLDFAVTEGTAEDAGENDIYIESQTEDTYKVGDEGYLIVTDDSGLKIYAPSYTGCLYGTISVEQILYQADGNRTVPKGITRDYPAYEIRGVMLDVARTPYRIQQLQDYAKILLWYKINEYHLHVNDNDNCNINASVEDHAGFHRLESERFPSLESEVKHAGVPADAINADYYLNNEDYQGNPQYTREEWRELQFLCSGMGINMITELDLPGHSLLYNKYADENPDNIPELEGGVKYTSGGVGTNGGAELMDLVGENSDRALWFAQQLWDEYTEGSEPFISGSVVHIGADEYWDHNTAGIKDAFAEFADSLRKVIQGNLGEDTKIRMWGAGTGMFSTAENVLDDVDIQANYQLDVWHHGYEDAKARAAEGYEIINCRDAFMYGNPGRTNRDVPNAEFVYNEWNPAMFRDGAPGTGRNPLLGEPNLLGAKTVIWGDQSQEGMTERDVNQRVLRAVSIVSEKTWNSTDENGTFEKFEQRAARLAEGPGTQIAMETDSKTSLVLDYDFDNLSSDGMTVFDTSGNGYNGTLSQAGEVSEDGYLTFGGSAVETPLKTLSYPYTAAFTVRIDAEEAEQNTTASSIFSGYDGQLQIAGTEDGSLSANVNYFTRDFNYSVPTDGTEVNVMLVGTFQGTKLYINGQLQTFLSQKTDQDGTAAGSVTTMYSSFPLPLEKIGEGLHGEIADLQVYNKAFSAEEAAAYYTDSWASETSKVNVAQDTYAGGTSRVVGDATNYDNADGRVRVAFKAVDGDAFTNAQNAADQMDETTSDIYSYWKGNRTDSSLSIDLGQVRNVSEVQIQWRYGGKGKDFDIQISEDGETWTTWKEIRGNQDFLSTISADGEPVQARYVRMQGISSNSVSGYMIQEFMVYEITDKTALADKLAEAQKIIAEKGLGFETEDSTDRELFEAAVQAEAVNENALTTADDIEQAAARLTAALEAQTEPEPEKEYAVTAGTADGAEITVPEKSKAGETVTIKVNVTDSDKEIDTVTVTGASGDVEVTKAGESEYTFIMPEEDVNVTVSLKDKAADKTALADAIKVAEEKQESDYTQETWGPFAEALAAAKLVNEDPAAKQSEVQSALDQLTAAMKALEEVTEEPIPEKPDKTALDQKIKEAGALKESDYTPATWKAFRDALNTAKLVSADPDAEQAEVDAALKNLENAINALKLVQQQPEKPGNDNKKPEKDTPKGAVQTGDTAPIGTLAAVMVTAALLAGGGAVIRRKHR